MGSNTIALLVLAAALISALDKALTEDVRIFPTLTMAWRAVIAAAGGVIVGALEQTVGGAVFLVSLAAGLSVAAPTLIRLLLVAVLPAAQVIKTIAFVSFLAAISSASTGCALAKPACEVIHVADYLCTTLVMADGSEVALTKEDAKDPEHLAAALGRRGVKGCK